MPKVWLLFFSITNPYYPLLNFRNEKGCILVNGLNCEHQIVRSPASKKRKGRAATLLNSFTFLCVILAWQGRVRIDSDFMIFKALNACAARYFCLNRRIQGGGLTQRAPYSLSNLSWQTAFSSFFPTKSSFLPSKLGKAHCSTTPCINILFVSNVLSVDFAH